MKLPLPIYLTLNEHLRTQVKSMCFSSLLSVSSTKLKFNPNLIHNSRNIKSVLCTMTSTEGPIFKVATGGIPLVKKLIEKAHHEFDIIYEVHLANHLPHALYTICSLGASLERIQEYNDHYVKRLEPLKAREFKINSSNWKDYIGMEKGYQEYLRFFDKGVNHHGLEKTFSEYFPSLMGASLGAALHPLIHIGFAIEFNDPFVLTEGLSYACTNPLKGASKIMDLPDSNLSSESKSSVTVLQMIDKIRDIRFPPLPKNIGNFHHKSEYLLEFCGDQFKNLVESWDLSSPDSFPSKLNELTETSILAALSTHVDKIDFFLVHGITANHGVRMIFPHLNESQQRTLLRANLIGLLTDYVVQQMPKVDVDLVLKYKPRNGDADEILWEKIISEAIHQEEEHVAKVVRSLIYYMENVPESKRSVLFTDEFFKKCAFRVVDIVKSINDYIFE